MKVSLTQENLNRALSLVSRIAGGRTTLPVLNNILIRAEVGQITLASTNMEISIIEKINAKVEDEGVLLAPARLLSEFVANLPKTNIDISSDDSKITVSAGSYSSTINSMSADDFPALPEPDLTKKVEIKAGILKKGIQNTSLVASTDNTRPILTGVYVHTKDGFLYMAATDGYRLAEKKVLECSEAISAIIPSNTLSEVSRIISNDEDVVTIGFNDNLVTFVIGDSILTSRVIDGNFIDYAQLIPKSTETVALVDRSELIRTTKVSELFAQESAGSITLQADAGNSLLKVHSITSQLGENKSEIDANVNNSGTITLNSKFLLDALNQIEGDTIKLQFNGKLAPALLTSESADDYKHIIMPVKS